VNSIAILGFLGRWVTFSAIVLAVGAVVFRSAVVDRTTLPHVVRGALGVRAAAVAATACILVLPAAGIKLFVQTAGMRFPDDPWTSVATRLVRMTPWGHLWIAQVGLAAALAMAFGVARVRPRAWRIAAPLALGLALTPTLASHAMSEHSDRVVTVAADVLHLLGASAWLGSLAMVLLSIWRGDAEDDDANQDRSPVSARSLAAPDTFMETSQVLWPKPRAVLTIQDVSPY
jgi:putative copper export protein